MKLLYILNVADRVNSFCESSILASRQLGIEFHVACNWEYKTDAERLADEKKYGIRIHQVDFIRNPLRIKNFKANKQLCNIIREEKIDCIHCNTPTGGLLGRLAGKRTGIKKVIYQAHGFHFYKGAPKLNWIIYYNIERWLARYTDALITINDEDFKLAKIKFRLRNNGNIYHVLGVGVDISEYDSVPTNGIRQSLGIGEDEIVLVYTGRLDSNKNIGTVIRAVAKVPNVKFVICGTGTMENKLRTLAKELSVYDRVLFLGLRTDVDKIYNLSDVMILMSFREGLSRTIMEAMASGLPCVVSKIRGNTDLIDDGAGGFLVPVDDVDLLAERIRYLAENKDAREKMSAVNKENVKKFSLENVVEQMKKIYEKVFEG